MGSLLQMRFFFFVLFDIMIAEQSTRDVMHVVAHHVAPQVRE